MQRRQKVLCGVHQWPATLSHVACSVQHAALQRVAGNKCAHMVSSWEIKCHWLVSGADVHHIAREWC
jgi:hypothetical protein